MVNGNLPEGWKIVQRVWNCFHPENRHDRRATWSEENPQGRWRYYTYEET